MPDGSIGNGSASMEVDHAFDLKLVIDQTHMSADGDVAVIAGGRRELTLQILGHRVHFPAQIRVEHSAFPEPGFLIGRQAVLAAKSCGRI